jgi:hypothetical protein
MRVTRRQDLVEPSHPSLSIVTQCRLLSISRSGWYYEPVPESEAALALMQVGASKNRQDLVNGVIPAQWYIRS